MMVDVAKVTSPVNTNRFRLVIDNATESKIKIQILEVQLPLAEVGLLEECESFELLPSVAHVVFEQGFNLRKSRHERIHSTI
ncbi:hypothetical protein R6Q57_003942 [Mikania cordata]